MNASAMEKYLSAGNQIYHCTSSGPLTAVVMPFDFLFLEMVKGAEPLLGVRTSIFLRADSERLVAVNKFLISCSQTSSLLQLAADEDAD